MKKKKNELRDQLHHTATMAKLEKRMDGFNNINVRYINETITTAAEAGKYSVNISYDKIFNTEYSKKYRDKEYMYHIYYRMLTTSEYEELNSIVKDCMKQLGLCFELKQKWGIVSNNKLDDLSVAINWEKTKTTLDIDWEIWGPIVVVVVSTLMLVLVLVLVLVL